MEQNETKMNSPELYKALIKFNSLNIVIPKERVNKHFGNTYADIADILQLVRMPLASCGLCVTQIILPDWKLQTALLHESGQSIYSITELPKYTKSQEAGAILTYFRRYAVSALLGLASDDDDDGNSTPSNQKPSAQVPKQENKTTEPEKKDGPGRAALRKYVKENGVTGEILKTFAIGLFKIEDLTKLTDGQCLELLNALYGPGK